MLAREEERRRIRRDLHDGLGPTLASAVFQFDAARDLIVRDPEAADALLGSLREGLQTAVADVRALVYALRPPALDELGLVPALHEQAARLHAAATVRGSRSTDPTSCRPAGRGGGRHLPDRGRGDDQRRPPLGRRHVLESALP